MRDWIVEPLQHAHFQRALAICLMAGFTNGYLSAFVVLRRSALQVGALSHSLLPGLAVGVMLFGLTQVSLFVGALVAALIVGLGSLIIARNSRLRQETALAILYSSAFAAGILLLEFAPVTVDVDQFLFGNILFASAADLRTVFAVSLVSLVTLTALRRPIVLMLFEPASAQALGVPVRLLNYALLGVLILVLISTLQTVGCLLALGLLVTPAATVYLLTDRVGVLLWGGGVVGATAAVSALFISHHFDTGPGAAIVILLGSAFLVAWTLSPRYGLVATFRQRRAARSPAAEM